MTLRGNSQRRMDDAAFPVRVKMTFPANGLGRSLPQAYGRLNRAVGPGQHAQHGAATLGGGAPAYYFRDVEAAGRFLEAFLGFALADETCSTV